MRRWLLLVIALGCGNAGTLPADLQPSDARTLSELSTALPESTDEQAMMALRQEAWRREHRFRDAADPGYLFRATRVTQAEIDSGRWAPEDMFQLGGQLFDFRFTRDLGYGGADLPPMSRFHHGQRGGPDTTHCAACHWRGGPAGAGDAADNAMLLSDGDSASLAIARNPPSLVGAGFKELIAGEMTAELQNQRDDAVAFSAEKGYAVRIDLTAKGISFGRITVNPDGEVDLSEVEGVDDDLMIKAFGWKGTFPSIRDVAEDALNIHHGMQSDYLAEHGSRARMGSYGGDDPDGDGVEHEIIEGQMTALTLFIAMQEVPEERPPDDSKMLLYWARGREDFDTLGCGGCHVPTLPLDSPRFRLESRVGGPSYSIYLPREGAQPTIAPDPETGEWSVRMFTDLKRHHMGDELAESRPLSGLDPDEFITPPLWGIARSRPYLHDARAPTLEDAILAHGGEAKKSRDAFAALDDLDRAPLRVFLTSLTRAQRMVSQ